MKDIILNKDKIYDIDKFGFYIYKNILSLEEIENIKTQIENNKYKEVKDYLFNTSKLQFIVKNTNYIFQDYIWIIKRSSIHTCHRDNNGDFFNKNQKYPSYTSLIYLENMDKCLGVIPYSHKLENKNKYNINLTNQVKNIICNKGDMIIFNANLIHVGIINPNKEDNLRIQLKISHKDDLKILNYFQNYNKILNKKNNLPYEVRHIQKNISCMFPFISDLTHDEIVKGIKGQTGYLQKLFSYFYYGDSKFYDLPNAY